MKSQSYSAEELAISAMEATKWRRLAQEFSCQPDKVPKGFFTSHQIAKLWKQSVSRTQQKLKALAESGKVETDTFRIQLSKKVQRVRHYRVR